MPQVLRGQPLVGMELAELENLLGPQQPAFRAKQLYDALYRKQVANLSEMFQLAASASDRAVLHELCWACRHWNSVSTRTTVRAAICFVLNDNRTVETVLMPEAR